MNTQRPDQPFEGEETDTEGHGRPSPSPDAELDTEGHFVRD